MCIGMASQDTSTQGADGKSPELTREEYIAQCEYLSYSGKNPIPFLHSQLQITLAQLQKLTQYLDTLSPLKRRIQITHVDPTYELLLQGTSINIFLTEIPIVSV